MQILPDVELFACGLLLGAIAWLRHLYGASMTVFRYSIPFLLALVFLLVVIIQHPTTLYQPDMEPPDLASAVALHIGTAAMALWLVIEVLRYRTHLRDVSHRNQP